MTVAHSVWQAAIGVNVSSPRVTMICAVPSGGSECRTLKYGLVPVGVFQVGLVVILVPDDCGEPMAVGLQVDDLLTETPVL